MAPRPGVFDHGANCVGWKSHATHEALPGVHDLALLERVWKTRGSLLRSHPLGLLRRMGLTRARRYCSEVNLTTRSGECQCPGRILTPEVKLPISRCHRLDTSLKHEISGSSDSSGAEPLAHHGPVSINRHRAAGCDVDQGVAARAAATPIVPMLLVLTRRTRPGRRPPAS